MIHHQEKPPSWKVTFSNGFPTWCCVKTSWSLALSIWCTLVSKTKDPRWVTNTLSWWSRIPSDLHQVGAAGCQDFFGLGFWHVHHKRVYWMYLIYIIYIVYVYYMYNIVYPQDSKVYLNYSRLPASGSWPVVWYSCCMSYNWAIYNLHTAVCTTAGRQRRNLQEWFIKPKIHVTWQNCSDWGLSSIEMSQVSTLFGGFSHLLFWHKGLWHILRGIRSHSALDGFFGIIMIFWNIPSLIAWQQTLWNSN